MDSFSSCKSANNNLFAFSFIIFSFLLLSACVSGGGGGSSSGATGASGKDIGGVVIDGPVINANVSIYDAAGQLITTTTTNENAQFTAVIPDGTNYPLQIIATGGTNTVTNAAVNIELRSIIASNASTDVQINILSTLAYKSAQAMTGGLSVQNFQSAESYVINALVQGVSTDSYSQTTNGTADGTNILESLYANEAVAEIIRRLSRQVGSSADSIITALAEDLTDNVLDGTGGANSNSKIAALSHVVKAQVSSELLTNTLSHNQSNILSAIQSSAKSLYPALAIPAGNPFIKEEIINQVFNSLTVASKLDSNPALVTLINNIKLLRKDNTQAEIDTIINAGMSTIEGAIYTSQTSTSSEIASANQQAISNAANIAPTSSDLSIRMLMNTSVSNTVKASDADNDALLFTVVKSPIQGQVTINETNGDFNYTPTQDYFGLDSFQVRIEDTSGAFTYAKVSVTIDSGGTSNTKPIASAGSNISVTVGKSISLNGLGSTDKDGDSLSYKWSFTAKPNGSSVSLSSASIAVPSFTPDVAGTYSLQLVVNDGTVNSAPDTMYVIASSVPSGGGTSNTKPIASAGANISVTIGNSVALNGAGSSDQDGDSLSYKWSFTAKPNGSSVSLSSTSAVKPTFTPDAAGTYSLQLVVNDGTVNSAPDTMNVIASSVPSNTKPIASAGSNILVTVGNSVALNGSGSTDQDGDSLSYKWSFTAKPNGSSVSLSSTSLVAPTFTPDVIGAYTLQLVVNDGTVNSAPDTMNVTASAIPANGNGTKITTVKVSSTSNSDQTNVPVTFGHVFIQGDVAQSNNIHVEIAGVSIPTQFDIKATYSDKSVRHAIISLLLPTLAAGQTADLDLVVSSANSATGTQSITQFRNSAYNTTVDVTVGGTKYSASAKNLLASGTPSKWIDGGIVTEWHASAPLIAAGNNAHPHLTARFYVRDYNGESAVRTSVIIENTHTYVANPQNFTYDVVVKVAGNTVLSQNNITHFRQARWRKTYWWKQTPQIHIAHNTAYMISTKAVSNYDPSVVPAASTITKFDNKWETKVGSNGTPIKGIMGTGLISEYMPSTGGRGDIGPLPDWTALYLISMDKEMKKITLGTSIAAGSWGIHYRNKNTGRPVTIDEYPYMTLLGRPNDTYNPNTGKNESFPACGGNCSTPYTPDSSHQPSLAYVPYLVTGDFYHLEELVFWANWNMLQGNPGYRGYTLGKITWDQVRGQAWSLRTMGHAAYILPDNHAQKNYFITKLGNNLTKFDQLYTNNPNATKLGYAKPTINGTLNNSRPWMDDYFTWSIGYLTELGFSNAQGLFLWKAKFPIGRMTNPGFCWIYASGYDFKLGVNNTPYSTFKEIFDNTYPGASSLACGSQTMADAYMKSSYQISGDILFGPGDMLGYSDSTVGFPSNMQPALAVVSDSGATNGKQSWTIFNNRTTKPNYSGHPQFAIIPRK